MLPQLLAEKRRENATQSQLKCPKGLLQNASIRQLLDDDLKREAKYAKTQIHDDFVILGDRDSVKRSLSRGMLTQSLRERFPNAVGD